MAISEPISTRIDTKQPAYVQQIRNEIAQAVHLESVSSNSKIQNDALDSLLEEPELDIISATLILGQLLLIQSNFLVLSKTLDVQDKTEKILSLRRESSKFHSKIADIRRDTEEFIATNTVTDLEKDKYSYGRQKLLNFTDNLKAFFSNQKLKIEKAEEEFMDAVGQYFVGSGLNKILDELSHVSNLVDSINPADLPNLIAFDTFKKVEGYVAKFVYGSAVGVTLPGTGEVVRGLYTIQSAVTDVISNVTTAIDHTISSVLKHQNDLINLDNTLLTELLENSSNQFNSIYQILRIYYEGLLDIATRLRV